VKGKVVPVFN